mgnify:CR=1 FL=1
MTEIENYLITNSSPWVIMVIPVLAFLESCALIGLLVSGILLLTVSTLLYSSGTAEINSITFLAFCGAAAGDQTGFLLGRMSGDGIWKTRLLCKHIDKKEKIQKLMKSNASWAIFIGRFTPAVRSITPIMAGLAKLSVKRFLTYDLTACFFWALGLYLLVKGVSSFQFLSFLGS